MSNFSVLGLRLVSPGVGSVPLAWACVLAVWELYPLSGITIRSLGVVSDVWG